MPDIVVTVIEPDRLLAPNSISDNPLPDHPYKCLAQGDSWFSIGALPPWATSSLVEQFILGVDTVIVNCAYPGSELAHMTDTSTDTKFLQLLAGKLSYKWDAILLSGGGNDLIDALGAPVGPDPSRRLLRTAAEWGPVEQGVDRYVSEDGWNTFTQHMNQVFDYFLKACGTGQNAATPIIFHTYDYPTPRNAPAPVLGPWLYPALKDKYAIPEPDWIALARNLIDRLANFFGTQIRNRPASNLQVVDTRGTITPAQLDTNGPSGDWQNEIHPSGHGYAQLARKWRPVIEAAIVRNS